MTISFNHCFMVFWWECLWRVFLQVALYKFAFALAINTFFLGWNSKVAKCSVKTRFSCWRRRALSNLIGLRRQWSSDFEATVFRSCCYSCWFKGHWNNWCFTQFINNSCWETISRIRWQWTGWTHSDSGFLWNGASDVANRRRTELQSVHTDSGQCHIQGTPDFGCH